MHHNPDDLHRMNEFVRKVREELPEEDALYQQARKAQERCVMKANGLDEVKVIKKPKKKVRYYVYHSLEVL